MARQSNNRQMIEDEFGLSLFVPTLSVFKLNEAIEYITIDYAGLFLRNGRLIKNCLYSFILNDKKQTIVASFDNISHSDDGFICCTGGLLDGELCNDELDELLAYMFNYGEISRILIDRVIPDVLELDLSSRNASLTFSRGLFLNLENKLFNDDGSFNYNFSRSLYGIIKNCLTLTEING
jgi:hypothetical protein